MSTTDDPIIAIAVPDSFVFDLELTKRFKFKTDLKPITLLRKE